ncbi:interferon-inducible GTPase 5-like [Scomber scombrus]|uniref:interferon-inducible GTPase 5-like n=1 Tax=Scomber scombrus TaxID=13677 RepID=UPI002DD89B77|nr:interferon-inducible GTPase 5-like [Scomber scombrus]
MDSFDDDNVVLDDKEALQNNDQSLAAENIHRYLDRLNNTPLNIAITGESGAGKSTFVNAFRGIDNRDKERAAPTGVVETTSEVTPEFLSSLCSYICKKTSDDWVVLDVKEALQNNDQSLAAENIQRYLDRLNNTPLKIAITGESGAGKSTFVNAFRGIDNRDKERAAPTGVVETTSEVTPYPHPNYPNVTLWDLPGIGTTSFPADKYLKHVGFEKFDFFIIISDTRFRENDVKLAQEIRKMGKKFYFVRSKIDHNLRDEERSQKEFNEERSLTEIRENCIKGLQKQGFEAPQVFLVSSVDLHLYDFHLLEETLERELPAHKKDVLLLAVPNVSLEIINKKKDTLQAKIKYYAMLSAVVGGVPVPGISSAVDIGMIVGVVTQYKVAFGLNIPSLERLAQTTGVPLDELRAVMISPLATKKLTPDLVMKLLSECITTASLMAAEEVSRFIPIFGIPAAMCVSFASTYKILNTFLDMLAIDAQRVFTKALGLDTAV